MRRQFQILVVIVFFCNIPILYGCKQYFSRVGDELINCLQECSDTDTTHLNDNPLRIVTLNFYHGFPKFKNLYKRLNIVAKYINDSNADIVFLQEVPWLNDTGLAVTYLSRITGLNYTYVRANGNFSLIRFEEGLAILSRFPLSNPNYTELLPAPGGFEHRAVLSVKASTHLGNVNLVTTHLSRRKQIEINKAQVSSLTTYVKSLGDLPAVVAGDFNAVEDSPQITRLSKQWIDAFRQVNPDLPGRTCCLHRNKLDLADPGQPHARLDYIFLVPNRVTWKVLHSETTFDQPFINADEYQWASNHYGVLADAQISNRLAIISQP